MTIKKSLSLKILGCLISTQFLFSCDSDQVSAHKHQESGNRKSSDQATSKDTSDHWTVSQLTEKQIFTVIFSCLKKPYVGDFQSCQLQIKQGDKEISDAKVSIEGGMKMHGHGLPTSPKISSIDASGRYEIEGLEFSMPGDWVIGFRISANQQTDQTIFKLAI